MGNSPTFWAGILYGQITGKATKGGDEVKPYYEQDGITIYHADCREVLPLLEPVDLLLTDPPYGINIANNPFRQKYAKSNWDNSTPTDEVFSLLLKGSKHQVIWGGNYFNLPLSQCFYVWDKVQPEKFSSAMCEMAWVSKEAPAKMYRHRVTDYFKEHPTEKPVELMRWCVGQFPDTKTILDPFMGSGTTLRAAKDLGLQAIGIELNEAYCEIAAKRLQQQAFDFSVPA